MNDSIFTQIIKGEIPSHTIYEDDDVIAFLDIFPVATGHTLVVPKNQKENLLESLEEDVSACMRAIRKLAPVIVETVQADGFNVTSNIGSAAGQTVFHTHFHIIPRFDGDGKAMWQKMEETPNFVELSETIRQKL